MTVFAGDPINASDLNGILPIMARKAVDEVAPLSTAVVQDDDALFVSVEANSVYFVTAWLRFVSVSTVPDLRLNYSYPAGASFARSDWGAPSASTTSADTIDTTIATTADNGRGALTSERTVIAMGELTTGATAGTFRVRFGQVTSSVDSVTMKAGSRIVLQKFA